MKIKTTEKLIEELLSPNTSKELKPKLLARICKRRLREVKYNPFDENSRIKVLQEIEDLFEKTSLSWEEVEKELALIKIQEKKIRKRLYDLEKRKSELMKEVEKEVEKQLEKEGWYK